MKNSINNPSDLNKYGKHYSESGFWDKIRKFAGKIGRDLLYKVMVLYYVMRSPDVSVRNKMIVIGALGYFILPVDLIPDWIVGLGMTDDATAITLAYVAVKDSITPEIEARARGTVQSWVG